MTRIALLVVLMNMPFLAACSEQRAGQNRAELAQPNDTQPKETPVATDDALKKAKVAIKAARKNGDTKLQLGGIEWDIPLIPDEIETLDKLESLTINAELVTDYSPLAKLPQLRSLAIGSVGDVDLSPLGQLGELRELEITGDGVQDLKFLAKLTKLESLHVQGPLKDWQALSTLKQLKQLDVQSDYQKDLTPLSKLTRLEHFSMTDGLVTNLKPLSGLKQLRDVEFFWGSVDDIRPLAKLKQLERLKLYATYEVTDLSPLFGLTRLKQVELTDCTGLTKAEVDKLRKALPDCEIK